MKSKIVIIAIISIFCFTMCSKNKYVSVEKIEKIRDYLSENIIANSDIGFQINAKGIEQNSQTDPYNNPLPWVNTDEYQLSSSQIEEWLNSLTVSLDHTFRDSPRLEFKGDYSSDSTDETVALTSSGGQYFSMDRNNDSTFTRVLKSYPLDKFGGRSLQIISHLKLPDETPLVFPINSIDTPAPEFFIETDKTGKKMGFDLPLPIEYFHSKKLSGYLEIRLLAPQKYAYTVVKPENGKNYKLGSSHFTVWKYAPGDLIITTNSTDFADSGNWKYICVKKDTLVDSSTSAMESGGINFIKKMYNQGKLTASDIIETCDLEGDLSDYSKDEIKQAIAARKPTQENIDSITTQLGSSQVAYLLLSSNKGFDFNKYHNFYLKYIQMAYNDRKSKKRNGKNMLDQTLQQENLEEAKKAYEFGENIYDLFQTLSIPNEPHWNLFDQGAKDALKIYATNSSALNNQRHRWNDSLETFRNRYQAISVMTDKAIDLLTLKNPKKMQARKKYAIWYKTNIDADSIYIYKKDSNPENEVLETVKAYPTNESGK